MMANYRLTPTKLHRGGVGLESSALIPGALLPSTGLQAQGRAGSLLSQLTKTARVPAGEERSRDIPEPSEHILLLKCWVIFMVTTGPGTWPTLPLSMTPELRNPVVSAA